MDTITGERTLAVENPYTGETIATVPLAGPDAVRAALDRAGSTRCELSRHERAQVLFGVADRVEAERESLAELITRESGLALADSRYETRRSSDVFRFAAMEALRDDGRVFACDTSANGRDRRAYTLQVPVRCVGAITPFNHPLNQVAHKVAPAIAIGAPIVCKPSERVPLTALRLGELIADAGLPDGLCTILCADPAEYLDALLAHDAVEVVSFTGGVAVGKLIAERLGYRRAVLELGGNDPLVVLEDADLDEAATLAVAGAFKNSGQRCTAVKRILAVDAVADALVERIVERTRRIVCGDPMDDATELGCVITAQAAAELCRRVEDAVADGGRLLAGGTHEGALMAPTVVDHVARDAELVTTETFGPVAPVLRVRDLDDAIAVANATPYALSAGVVTHDLRAINRCVRELRAGSVNVREVPGYRTELTPFGGVGDSGLGVKEGVVEAMKGMSYTKLYTLPWA